MTDTLTQGSARAVDEARILTLLTQELSIRFAQAQAAVELLDQGSTVPFIARYRKEATGGLDDGVLRDLEVRLVYLRELEARRISILDSIEQQNKLSPELEQEINAADTKQRLEDLYKPYRPKRRTRAQIAREAGLDGLVNAIAEQPTAEPLTLAADYTGDAPFDTAKAALDGARDILAETYAENAELLTALREQLWQQGLLISQVVEGKENEGANFRDWFDFQERLATLPSHRTLALLRGRQQGVLSLRIGLSEEQEALHPHPCVAKVAELVCREADFSPTATARGQWYGEVCRWTWRVRLLTSFETELITRLREEAEHEATRVFAANLRDLLLAAPAGPKAVLGLDPGIRTGVKVAAIDATGKLLDTTTIYPFEPRRDRSGSIQSLAKLIQQHQIELVAVGNGTGSRETEALVTEVASLYPDLTFTRITVSEAGASVYSASELAAKEFPDLDVSLRGAVSIARRLQDPLAELVKIDPKAIGVGQYQHDVNQRELARSLETVVEDCVNAVGVDLNTASSPLLMHVSGLNSSLAQNIVAWRNQHGAFKTRKQLLEVPRFGPKAFEQAAGFLRIANGDNPLDASAVHPEAYPVAQKILARLQQSAQQVMGQSGALKGLSLNDFTDEQFGLPTVQDIFSEIEKPGRDPRPEFQTAQFMEGLQSIKDLQPGMVLEGVVTNVANFGAFVDVGVHQDGLVHISALADKFVSDPRDVVRVGQTVKVKVLEVDVDRKRIGLSMRLQDDAASMGPKTTAPGAHRTNRPPRTNAPRAAGKAAEARPNNNAMAAAFARLKQ